MYTYFLKNNINDLVKIGYTKNLEQRVKSINGQCSFVKVELLFTIEGNHEKYLHDYYKESRKEGEWFEIPTLTEEYIKTLIAEKPKNIIEYIVPFNPDIHSSSVPLTSCDMNQISIEYAVDLRTNKIAQIVIDNAYNDKYLITVLELCLIELKRGNPYEIKE